MPVIRVSKNAFRRLQAIAVPLIDSPGNVIDRLLDLHERSSKMTMLNIIQHIDRSVVERLSAAGGYVLLAQRQWIDHHLENSIGREAFYCRGVGAPMRNVPS